MAECAIPPTAIACVITDGRVIHATSSVRDKDATWKAILAATAPLMILQVSSAQTLVSASIEFLECDHSTVSARLSMKPSDCRNFRDMRGFILLRDYLIALVMQMTEFNVYTVYFAF